MARIAVETATLGDWNEAGDRLRELEPDEFKRMLALARAFVAVHDRELEPLERFDARLAEVRGRKATS